MKRIADKTTVVFPINENYNAITVRPVTVDIQVKVEKRWLIFKRFEYKRIKLDENGVRVDLSGNAPGIYKSIDDALKSILKWKTN